MNLTELQRELNENEEERIANMEARENGFERPQDKYRIVQIIVYAVLGLLLVSLFLFILLT